jgi:hypothetical protein
VAKAMPTPAAAAQKWANNLGAATAAYTAGVQAVTSAPGQAAAAAVDRYISGTQAGAQKFAAKSAAVSLTSWQQSAINKGAPRLATGAAAAQPKFTAALTQLFPAIQQAVASLPPKGNLQQNIARSVAFQTAMANYKSQGG